MRKKILYILLASILALSLCACSSKGNSTEDGTTKNDSSSESDEDDKDNADEFPDGDNDDSETTVNPDEDDKDSEDDSTTPDEDDKDSEDDSTEPTDPDDGDDEPVHTCSYNTVKNDATNHWYVCSCGKTANKSAHNYSNDSDTTCNTCSYTREVTPDEPVHTCSYDTVKSDATNHWYECACGNNANKSAHNYSNQADTTCNTCGYTRTVVTPEPEKPATIPSVSWTGGDITLGSLGISIPTLKDFNDEALTDNTNNTGWAGAVSTDAEQTLANTLNSVRDAMINQGIIGPQSQGFAVEHYQISWSYTSYSSSNDLMLYRNPLDKTYTLTINTPLDSDVFGAHDVAPYSRDVLLTMLSTISSNPNELYNYIYNGLYIDSTTLNTSKYKSVGDCKMLIDMNESYKGHYVFKIKGL